MKKYSSKNPINISTLLSKQEGVVLFIALMVLVALALAAVALVRSADTANIIAGNLSFRQGAVSAADIGVAAATQKFSATASGVFALDTNTTASAPANCYSSTRLSEDASKPGVPVLLTNKSAFDSTYTACKINVAGSNEVVRYIIDRQCITGTVTPDVKNYPNDCQFLATSTKSKSDNDLHTGVESIPLYRVTVRVDSAKNTTIYTQAIIRP